MTNKPKCPRCNVEITALNIAELREDCQKSKCQMRKDRPFEAACDILEIDPQDIHPISSGEVVINEQPKFVEYHYQNGFPTNNSCGFH